MDAVLVILVQIVEYLDATVSGILVVAAQTVAATKILFQFQQVLRLVIDHLLP